MKGSGVSAVAMQNNNNSNVNDKSPTDTYEKHIAENNGDYQVRPGKYENLTAKILCVLTAIILWFYVVITDTTTDEKVFSGIGISIRNIDRIEEELGLSVITGYDSYVDLTVKGAKTDIYKLSANDISAYVDAREITGPGEYTLEIKTALPSGMSVSSQSTNYITIYVDKRTTKSVRVRVNPSFAIESNYSMGTPEPSIDMVNVSGPAEVLDEIDSATVSLDLGKVTKTITATGKLELTDKNGSIITNPYVKLQTQEVTVRFPVYTYKEVPLTVSYKYGYYNDSNITVKINPETIRVKGEPEDLENMDSILLMQLDEKKITGDMTQTVAIMLSDDVENVSGIKNATVTITHKNTETYDIVVTNITVKNPNNLNYTIDTTSLNVRFRGTSTLLRYLNPNNIMATLDLGYLNNASGTVSVPVTISVKSDLAGSVYEIGEYKIDVTIY
jgi:YbbR domain-containing protein